MDNVTEIKRPVKSLAELIEENNELRKKQINSHMMVMHTREWYRDQIVWYHQEMLAISKKLYDYVDEVLGTQNKEFNATRTEAINQLESLNKATEKALEIGVPFTREMRNKASSG